MLPYLVPDYVREALKSLPDGGDGHQGKGRRGKGTRKRDKLATAIRSPVNIGYLASSFGNHATVWDVLMCCLDSSHSLDMRFYRQEVSMQVYMQSIDFDIPANSPLPGLVDVRTW